MVVALLLKLLTPELDELLNIVINFTSIFLFAKIATIIHETGHLLAAYWVGGTPRRMILGTGHEIFRTEWNGIKIILKSVPLGGMALATFTELSYVRLRFAFYLIGGVLLSVATALIFYSGFGYDFTFYSGIHLISTFIFVNALSLINLIPFYSSYYGHNMPTDGLGLLMILLVQESADFQSLKYSEEYIEAFECFENKDYDKAFALYEGLHNKIPEELSGLSMMATIRIKQAHPDDAFIHLPSLEEKIKEKRFKRIRGLIYNNIAWAYLLKNDVPLAYSYISLAFKEMRTNKVVIGTYGTILIEKGDVDIGMQWVLHTVDFKHANDSTLVASMCMMLGHHLKKNYKARDKHYKYVKANEGKLEKDSLLLWKRCLERAELGDAMLVQ